MKNKKFLKFCLTVFILCVVMLPVLSLAQTNAATAVKVCSLKINNIGDVICKIGDILNALIPVLVLLGVVYFVWGVISFMIGADEEQKTKGRNKIIYGIIGLVVIVGMWGIVGLVKSSFGLDQANSAIINPANIVDNNLQVANSKNCFSTFQSGGKLGDLFNYATCIISTSVIPLLFVLATAIFVWGVVQYVINDQEEAKRAKGRSFMIWGIIALTVMVSIWGLVGILRNTFGIDNVLPQVKSK